MIRRPPRSTRTDPLFPYTTLFRSARFERVDLQGQGIRLQPLPGGVVPVSTPEPSAPDPRGQIKTRQRVRDLAEVFTHEREVKAMLDLIPDMFPAGSGTRAVDPKFLEPARGAGNFLGEIRRRNVARRKSAGRGKRGSVRVNHGGA